MNASCSTPLPLARDRAQALLAYWFDGADDTNDIRPGHSCYQRWFGAEPQVDADVRAAFGADMQAARAGACAAWSTPAELLALVLLLDQVPRHVWRGSPHAFASDADALSLALRCLEQGFDRRLRFVERVFLLLPLQHAERIEDHHTALARFGDLAAQAHVCALPIAGFVDAAMQSEHEHQGELRRFGRYPGRNAALGRLSTPAELAHLDARRRHLDAQRVQTA
jgi:uncharacterized protein (DUF924 family)